MPDATVRIYKLFAFDVHVEEAKDPIDAINLAEKILDNTSLLEAFERFDGEEIFDGNDDPIVTNFDGKEEFDEE